MKYNVNLKIKAIPNKIKRMDVFEVCEHILQQNWNIEAQTKDILKHGITIILKDFEKKYDVKVSLLEMNVNEEPLLNTSKGHTESLINTINKLWLNENNHKLFKAILKAYSVKYNIDDEDYIKDFRHFAYKFMMYSCSDEDLYNIIKFVDKK